MIGFDWLKYRFGSVNISLDWVMLLWISYYWSRLVNIGLDGLNKKKPKNFMAPFYGWDSTASRL